jgi:radical SAM protein with 4Fe4S-binding SPASM domain
MKIHTITKKIKNPNLTQIAFGIGALNANPDLWEIMEYCRTNDYNQVVPNITINGIDFTDEQADNLVRLCGAVAISHYSDDNCYDAAKKLSDRGLKQINIHKLLCQETLESCYKVISDSKTDKRLAGLNAIVFLLMKPKGKRNKFHQLMSLKEYKKLIDYAFDNKVPIGFDSCSAPSFLKAVKDRKDFKELEILAEPCESTCFSAYIDVNGDVWPCSFCENHKDLEPLNILKCKDFIDDVWNGKQYSDFRGKLLKSAEEYGCRSCPIFKLDME